MEEQILSETLRIGDKLPSIRSIQKIYNVSLNTVKQAFLELELLLFTLTVVPLS